MDLPVLLCSNDRLGWAPPPFRRRSGDSAMCVHSRQDLGSLGGGLAEADLLARLADAVLDYVADRHITDDPVGVHPGQAAT